MTFSLQIEKAELTDIGSMLKLWKTIPGLGIGNSDEEELLEIFINRNPSTCLVLRTEKVLLGTILGGFDGRRGYIYHLAVHPDYRGRGLGKLLLNNVVFELRKLGVQKIHLFVFNNNKVAVDFYHRQGWQLRQDIQVFSWDTIDSIDKY